jgi:hypothetical protein
MRQRIIQTTGRKGWVHEYSLRKPFSYEVKGQKNDRGSAIVTLSIFTEEISNIAL